MTTPAGPQRIVGLDVARGLAVLGMFVAHVGFDPPFDWAHPETWSGIASGRSAILFALLAGVSIALLSGREHPLDGVDLVRARVRILVRAALILTIGGVLEYFGTSLAIILPTYAALFVLSLPFLRWRPRALFIAAGVVGVVMPVLFALVVPFITRPALFPGTGAVVEFLVMGNYPGLVWMAFVLAGMGLGRLGLGSTAIQLRVLVAGAALAAIAYTLGSLGGTPPEPQYGVVDLAGLVTTEPHSGSPFEVVGSGGFALAVVALALLATRTRVARGVLYPLSSVGRMPLSAYSGHVIAFAVLGLSYVDETDNWRWFDFAVITLLACTLWNLALGAGPLERLVSAVSRRAAAVERAYRLNG